MEVSTLSSYSHRGGKRDVDYRLPFLRPARRRTGQSRNENTSKAIFTRERTYPQARAESSQMPTSRLHWLEDTAGGPSSTKKDSRDGVNNTLAALSRKGSTLVKRSRDSVGSLLKFSETDQDRPYTPPGSVPTANLTDYPESPTKSPSRPLASGSVWSFSRKSAQSSTSSYASSESVPETSQKDYPNTDFRNLGADCQRFLAKPVGSRTGIVRGCLQFILEEHGSGSTDEWIRLENLDQRCTILNKWWRALLDTLKAGDSGTLNNADRRTIHTAITGIVQRPEWKCRLSADIEPMVVQTVYIQLGYVVGRLSCRRYGTDSSLISMAGKFFAVAWYFCPGVADILGRLWNVSPNTVRRLNYLVVSENSKLKEQHGEQLAAEFPAHLNNLRFTSARAYTTFQQQPSSIPEHLHEVRWQDSVWLEKWSGRESGLFYEFIEAFYKILADFIPTSASRIDHLEAPGVMLVNAQILTVMESLITRSHGLSVYESADRQSGSTFDYLLKIDAMAPTLPIPSMGMQRPIVDSNLVAMFRQFLLRGDADNISARYLFAETFAEILKTTSKGVSLYDQNACFTLCDLLQEVIPVISEFRNTTLINESIIEWEFWLEVFKMMLKSESTMTEIRLYILLFSIWQTISASKELKQHICHNLLLEETVFFSRFNHWCPMVRTYYMRLLCWRVARLDGDVPRWEARIPNLLLSRLQTVWGLFKYDWCRVEGSLPMSIEPCNPIPGRRLFIIRTDFPTLSRSSTASSKSEDTDNTRQEIRQATTISAFSPSQLAEKLSMSLSMGASMGPEPGHRRKNSLLRSIMGAHSPESGSRSESPKRTSSSQAPSPQSSSPRGSKDSPRKSATTAAAASPPNLLGRISFHEHRPTIGSVSLPWAQSSSSLSKAGPKESVAYAGSFKFSLEPIDPRRPLPASLEPERPRLPLSMQRYLESLSDFPTANTSTELDATCATIDGANTANPETAKVSKYSGRALVEWMLVVNECQNFFERRRAEGVPSNALVETPVLGVECLKRPF